MSPKRIKAKGRRESGSYIALPHTLLRHAKFTALSPRATKLLMDLCSVYNGSNNGDMSTAWSVMRRRGWTSRDQVFKAQSELLETGFIVKTRQGGRNQCNLYALTFWAIDDCKGKLDVPATSAPPGDWKSFSVTRQAGEVDTKYGLHETPINPPHGSPVVPLTRRECKSA